MRYHAGIRDDRHKIVALAEEKSLSIDPALCAKARTDLTNPRTRLTVEISWLPGIAPKKAAELVSLVAKDTQAIRDRATTITPLALANLMASAFEILSEDLSTEEWVCWILEIGTAAEKIDSNDVLRDINEDRIISKFPLIKGTDDIESELAERRIYYKDAIKHALDRLPSLKLLKVTTDAVESATGSGKKQAPALINDMVDSYALGIQTFLRQGADNILKLTAHIKTLPSQGEKVVLAQLDKLAEIVGKWDKFAQPIQVSLTSRGIEHDVSHKVAYAIRSLGIFLANDHNLLAGAAATTKILQECFSELPELSDRVDEDAKTLEDLTAKQQRSSLIAPIRLLCDKTFQFIEKEPGLADVEGATLLNSAQSLITDMKLKGVPEQSLNEARNYLAGTLMQCAIAYGNKVDRWSPCVKLLEAAQGLATSSELLTRINNNLATCRKNEKLGGLGSVSSPPTLSTFNTIGFTLYGASDFDPETQSVVATYYFVILMLPLIPISRYRVIQNGRSYRFLGKMPLRTLDKWHLGIVLAAFALMVICSK